jgi:hypothetical protein
MTSIIKVDNLQNQCGANIISESANVITIGASGDTVTLAAGASQSGFGRSGSVNWDTTPKTSSPVTAVSGNGYFINTTSGAITVNLPATPTAGDIVAVADYANTAATNNITVGRNGSKIDGETIDATIKTNGQVYTLVYVDSTEGWKTVNQTFNQINTALFVTATGGTITTCGNYKIHTFTGPGTFTVSCAGNPSGSSTVDYLVVAGGGGGGSGSDNAAGAGAGGFRMSNSTSMPAPTTSPLANPTGIAVTATSYPITVGSGGAGTPQCISDRGVNGNNSVFSTITSAGGGGGGMRCGTPTVPNGSGGPGGSGGGGGTTATTPGSGGTGNTPPVSPPQGNPGGAGVSDNASYSSTGGGGGAGAAGSNGTQPIQGAGGIGSYVSPSFVGTNGTTGPVPGVRYFSGGGGAGAHPNVGSGTRGLGGSGGGGCGASNANTQLAIAGTTNTGGGGGGGSNGSTAYNAGASGGSGIVVIRYKFQ